MCIMKNENILWFSVLVNCKIFIMGSLKYQSSKIFENSVPFCVLEPHWLENTDIN